MSEEKISRDDLRAGVAKALDALQDARDALKGHYDDEAIYTAVTLGTLRRDIERGIGLINSAEQRHKGEG